MSTDALAAWDAARVVDDYDEIRINTIIVAGDALRAALAEAEQINVKLEYQNGRLCEAVREAEQERDALRVVWRSVIEMLTTAPYVLEEFRP